MAFITVQLEDELKEKFEEKVKVEERTVSFVAAQLELGKLYPKCHQIFGDCLSQLEHIRRTFQED